MEFFTNFANEFCHTIFTSSNLTLCQVKTPISCFRQRCNIGPTFTPQSHDKIVMWNLYTRMMLTNQENKRWCWWLYKERGEKEKNKELTVRLVRADMVDGGWEEDGLARCCRRRIKLPYLYCLSPCLPSPSVTLFCIVRIPPLNTADTDSSPRNCSHCTVISMPHHTESNDSPLSCWRL